MQRRCFFKCPLGVFMAAITFFTSIDMSVLYASQDNITCDAYVEYANVDSESFNTEMPLNGYIPNDYNAKSIEEGADSNPVLSINYATVLPDKYSSVENGYVTSVKNQRQWGTCWAFAACAVMESYALTHRMADSADDIDFSEYALAYLSYSDDMYMEDTGDYTVTTDYYVGFNQGGNNQYAFKTLSKWAGIYNDDKVTYNYSANKGVIPEYVPDENEMDYVLTGQYYLNMSDTEQIKTAIINNGAVAACYYSTTTYAKNNHLYLYNYELESTNHAIAIVGWDDNKDKELFSMTDRHGRKRTPNNDGAWLIKNSWGTGYGQGGYCWISYEDVGLNSQDAVIYEIAPKDMFSNVYQYDGATIYYSSRYGVEFAAVYEIEGETEQTLEAVSFAIYSVNTGFTVNVYKNEGENTLDNGELIATQGGVVTHEGYYTVMLSEKVVLQPGDTITVVIVFEDNVWMMHEYNGFNMGAAGNTKTVCTAKEGHTYRKMYSNGKFMDAAQYGDLCIKAFTLNAGENIDVPQITKLDNSTMTNVVIEWQTIENADWYRIVRSTSADGENEVVIDEIFGNSYVDEDVEINTKYYYKVCAVVSGINGDYSQQKSITIMPPEVLFSGHTFSESVVLKWTPLPLVDGYNVYKSTDGGDYELIATLSKEEKSYSDDNIEYGENYEYTITSFVIIDDIIYESKKSAAYSANKPVAAVGNLSVDNRFYEEMIITWNKPSNEVDGIDVFACVGEDSNYTLIDSLPADSREYSFSTKELESGTVCNFGVSSYVMVGDEKIYGDMQLVVSKIVKERPIDVDYIKWYVEEIDEKNITVVRFKASDYDNYYIWYKLSESDNFKGCVLVDEQKDEEGYITTYIDFGHVAPFEIYITDSDRTTMFQEEAMIVNGAYVEPMVDVVYDISLDDGSTETVLHASILDKMEGFEYLYQWYEADSKDAEFLPMENQNEEHCKVIVNEGEEKYYYCEITVRYGETIILTTTNADGEKTKVTGRIDNFYIIEGIQEYEYTGLPIMPKPVVKNEEVVLREGYDYTLNYKDNINIGTATVIVNFIGRYKGTETINFVIKRANAENYPVSYNKEHFYNGAAIEPEVFIRSACKTLVYGKDYVLSYSDNDSVGTATMVVSYIGNYTGRREYTFEIIPAVPSIINSAVHSVNHSSLNISKITQGTKVKDFLSTIYESNYIYVRKANKVIDKNSLLGTGMTVDIIYNNNVVRSYFTVVTGDTNGDGKINITDMIAIKANILKKSKLDGVYLEAADVNGDGKINITDFIKVKASLLKKDTIVGVEVK